MSGRSRAVGSTRPSTTASNRCRSTAGSTSGSATSHTETARASCGPAAGRADRGPLQGEHRRDVGEQPDPVRGDDGDPDPLRRPPRPAAPTGAVPQHPGGVELRRPAAPPGSSSAERGTTRAARSRTRPARQADQAFGAVARASASLSASSSATRSASSRRRPATRSTVAGSSGSRVVAVWASSRCHRTSRATRSTPSGSKPIRVATARATGSPATLCSTRPPLPMSWSSAATSSTSGRDTSRISAEASMQVSTTWRSTVNRWTGEACGSSRIRSHSGSTAASTPVSSRVSQTASRPRPDASSRTSSCRAASGHGSGSGAPLRTSRAAVAGRQHDVALRSLGRGPQQQQRVVLGAGARRQDHLAAREREARARSARGPASGRGRGFAGGRARRRHVAR